MHNVMNALLNMILVSLPEELFLTLMTLIFLKRFDLLDIRMWRHNLKWIIIPTLPTIILINVFRYIIILPKPLISLMCLILMNVLMVYVIKKTTFENEKRLIIKTVLFTFLSFVMIALFEVIYIPIVLSLLHKPIEYFNNNIFYNLMLAAPSRIIEFCIIAVILMRKNNSVKINLFDVIIKNSFFKLSFLSMIVIVNLSIVYFAKLITVNNILANLGLTEQFIITILITTIPVILVTWFLVFVNYLLATERKIQQTYQNLIIRDDVVADVEDQYERS